MESPHNRDPGQRANVLVPDSELEDITQCDTDHSNDMFRTDHTESNEMNKHSDSDNAEFNCAREGWTDAQVVNYDSDSYETRPKKIRHGTETQSLIDKSDMAMPRESCSSTAVHVGEEYVSSCSREVVEFIDEYYRSDIEEQHNDSVVDFELYIPESTVEKQIIQSHENEDYTKDIDREDSLLLEDENMFLSKGCGCTNECTEYFSRDVIMKCRLDCLELDFNCEHHNNHLNILLLGELDALVKGGPETSQKEHKPRSRQRNHAEFLFRGVPVCRNFFLFVHGIGIKKYKNVLSYFKENGVASQQHGSCQKKLDHLTLQQRSEVIQFINNFSEQNSLVLPGRLPYFRSTDLHILPSSMNKLYVYDKYVKALGDNGKQPVSQASWYRCWNDFCKHIVIQKPRTDLCAVCQNAVSSLGKMQALSESVKTQRIQESLDHLNQVQAQRTYYKNVIADIAPLVKDKTLGSHSPCSYDGLMHYSFDFAQQIHLPHDSQQVGPLYFLTGYKVALFGVAVEPLQKFVLYIIPESCVVGKGSNVVISLLHHFFDSFGLGETDVICHADNCTGQNKNNYMMQYAVWRVLTGKHKSFQISFLPVGHTKFAPDLYFGLFKKKFRHSVANSIKDVCEIAVTACRLSNSISAVMVGNETGDAVHVHTYDWKSYFKKHNPVPISDLLSIMHLKTESSNPGVMSCSKSVPNERKHLREVKIFKDTAFGDVLPIIMPEGLSFQRQKYLYEKIRSFVSEDSKDVLCPMPKERVVSPSIPTQDPLMINEGNDQPNDDGGEMPQTSNGNTVTEQCTSLPTSKRKTPTCSYCGQAGHRNQYRNGKYFCKKRQAESS